MKIAIPRSCGLPGEVISRSLSNVQFLIACDIVDVIKSYALARLINGYHIDVAINCPAEMSYFLAVIETDGADYKLQNSTIIELRGLRPRPSLLRSLIGTYHFYISNNSPRK